MNSWRHWIYKFSLSSFSVCFGIIFLETNAVAQNITLDGTLGPAGAVPITPGAAPFPEVYIIPESVGQVVRNNLFHSFGQFNLTATQEARFQGSADIRNIFSRVTGGSPSSIDGLISTENLSANFYLINPSGILLGPNAQLNIGGSTRRSFVATTVDALVWADGSQFSAINPSGADSLLTIVGDPSGFLASQRSPSPEIRSTGNLLNVAEGQNLLFVGGRVTLDGSSIRAAGGRVELGGISSGVLGLQFDGNAPRIDPVTLDGVTRVDVSLLNNAQVDVRAAGGGDIAVYAQNLTIADGSFLRTGISPGITSGGKAGDIVVDAVGEILLTGIATFEDRSSIINSVGEGSVSAQGQGGDIRLKANILRLVDGAQIFASTFGESGDIPNTIEIRANQIYLTGGRVTNPGNPGQEFATSRIESRVQAGAVGVGGNLQIITNLLEATDGAYLSTSTGGVGNAGRIIIDAPTGQVTFAREGPDGIASGAYSQVVLDQFGREVRGDAGFIQVQARSLFLLDGGRIFSSTNAIGNAGRIEVVADNLFLSGERASDVDSERNPIATGIYSRVEEQGNGIGGNIEISARELRLENGAVIDARTRSQADGTNAGDITILQSGIIVLDGVGRTSPSGLFALTGGPGEGGDLRILNTGQLIVRNRAQISARTEGTGDAGTLEVNADSITVDGRESVIDLDTRRSLGGGSAGILTINTQRLEVQNGGIVTAKTFGSGDGGILTVNASDFVRIDGNGSVLRFETSGPGNARGLTISTRNLFVQNRGEATVQGLGPGSGSPGTLNVTANSIFMQSGGRLTATTFARTGGNISIQFGDLTRMFDRSKILASALGPGDGGNIEIRGSFIVSDGRKKDNDVLASAIEGSGGRITATLAGEPINFIESSVPTPRSDFSAGSEFGNPGVIILDIQENQPEEAFPLDFLRAEIAQGCRALRARGNESKFVITGRGGLPADPKEALSGNAVQVDLVSRDREPQSSTPTVSTRPLLSPPLPAPEPIIEAQGWVMDSGGTVTLVAHHPASASPLLGQPEPDCVSP